MPKRLYTLCLWTATLIMLLSTVVMHHHHYERVCIAVEHCADDEPAPPCGDTPEAEEGHSHGEAGRGSCSIHQLHYFIISKNATKGMRRHIIGDATPMAAALPCNMPQPICSGTTSVTWQHTAASPVDAVTKPISRRGPPQYPSSMPELES